MTQPTDTDGGMTVQITPAQLPAFVGVWTSCENGYALTKSGACVQIQQVQCAQPNDRALMWAGLCIFLFIVGTIVVCEILFPRSRDGR